MQRIPHDKTFDGTLAFLNNGYRFISMRCERNNSKAFHTRMMMRPITCVMGEDAVRMFYEPGRFTRKAAMPPTTLMSLQDRGSVMTLDGDKHLHRKRMFMSLMGEDGISELLRIFERHWHQRLDLWRSTDSVTLHFEMEEVLTRAVCEWTGITLTEDEASQRAREFSAMIEGAGTVGPRNIKGLALRAITERWARDLIDEIRQQPKPPEGKERSALQTVAWYREPDGERLDVKTAAVELLNILRPTVAVARFITFSALALHHYPQYREKAAQEDDQWREFFVQEVRRFYPFFPVVAGNAKTDFQWHGEHFSKGSWVMLDMHGTNHDPDIWDEPFEFRPERFKDWDRSPYNFIPQGGGELHSGHRCPGENITIALTKAAVRLLTTSMTYEVPKQDLSIDLSRMPAIPASWFVISNVKKAG